MFQDYCGIPILFFVRIQEELYIFLVWTHFLLNRFFNVYLTKRRYLELFDTESAWVNKIYTHLRKQTNTVSDFMVRLYSVERKLSILLSIILIIINIMLDISEWFHSSFTSIEYIDYHALRTLTSLVIKS